MSGKNITVNTLDFLRTTTGRCTVYVQYLYSICTLTKRTNTVHIVYKYCTRSVQRLKKDIFMPLFIN